MSTACQNIAWKIVKKIDQFPRPKSTLKTALKTALRTALETASKSNFYPPALGIESKSYHLVLQIVRVQRLKTPIYTSAELPAPN